MYSAHEKSAARQLIAPHPASFAVRISENKHTSKDRRKKKKKKTIINRLEAL
jgi:hypothetical protein